MPGSGGFIFGTTITHTKGDLLQAFTSPGTFTSPVGATNADLLVVAGGGGAGGSGGGGGAGGLRLLTSQPIPASPVTVTVGAGGAAGATAPAGGSGGSPSSFGPSYAASGGGFGYQVLSPPGSGGPGGSGGGAGGNSPTTPAPGGSGNSGGYTPAEGQPGGASKTDATTFTNCGSGGGHTGAGLGGNPPSSPYVGGAGTDVQPTMGPAPANPGFYPPFPSPRAPEVGSFAGGGGGRNETPTPTNTLGGTGSGGLGTTPSPGPANQGVANTGGGGGSATSPAGNGGSGFVGIKIANAGPVSASGVWTLQDQFEYKKDDLWT